MAASLSPLRMRLRASEVKTTVVDGVGEQKTDLDWFSHAVRRENIEINASIYLYYLCCDGELLQAVVSIHGHRTVNGCMNPHEGKI